MNFIIGVDDFGEVIQEGFDFIDKSLFIKEILDNAATKVTVITRPRRFGKTLNMQKGIQRIAKVGLAFRGKEVEMVVVNS